MTDFQPALSPAEWDANEKRATSHDAECIVGIMYKDTSGPRLYTSTAGQGAIVRSELLHATMALANDALPDDHPGKLTRADLADIADTTLAAKLSALLRP